MDEVINEWLPNFCIIGKPKKMRENFKEAYTPFLQIWSNLKSLEGESFAGGSSRKKRNLKKKKSNDCRTKHFSSGENLVTNHY